MNISENTRNIKSILPEGVTLVAVSKFHPNSDILEAYNAGQRIFGESRAQELVAKRQSLPSDIEWHFIGQLQSNKVKDIAPFIHTIHSIDSLKLIEEVEKQAAKHDRVIRILLEIHIAQEETKSGFTPGECRDLLSSISMESFPHVQIEGLMTMGTNTDNEDQLRKEFRQVKQLFDDIKRTYLLDTTHFNTLSMGMSSDYKLAISEGSNMVRIGSTIFGVRE